MVETASGASPSSMILRITALRISLVILTSRWLVSSRAFRWFTTDMTTERETEISRITAMPEKILSWMDTRFIYPS
jgi:hypothetical protein